MNGDRLLAMASAETVGASIAAAIIGSAAFFDPLTVTVPESRTGPSIRNISISIFLENKLCLYMVMQMKRFFKSRIQGIMQGIK